MRRTPFFLAFLAFPAFLACGNQLSAQPPGGTDAGGCVTDVPAGLTCIAGCSGQRTAPVCSNGSWVCETPTIACEDGGPPPEDSGPPVCSGPAPQLLCDDGCGSTWTTAICEGTNWTCPAFVGGACPIEDAGWDACAYPPPDVCTIAPPCQGMYYIAECSGGGWSCVLNGWCDPSVDAGWDAGEDANPPPSFSCGDLACDPATTYCTIDTGGPVQPDGGVGSYYSCTALPVTCNAGGATCGCVQDAGLPTCGCIEQNGDVIVTCDVP